MRALVAIDSFKGSFSSQEAANIVTQAFSKYRIVTDAAAIADGGEGTSAAYLANHSTAMWRQLTVTNMVGKPTPVQYVIDASQHLAIIDVAEASGIQFATTQDGFVDPLTTSSIGTGEMIQDATQQGVQKIVVALGGSGTTDAGIGLLGALGVKFYDDQGNELPPTVPSLAKVEKYNDAAVSLHDIQLVACADVDSPLTGPTGAVQMFGPQKGVDDQQESLEKAFYHFADVLDPTEHGQGAGDGAAGGMGFALRVLGAEHMSGFDFIANDINLPSRVAQTDFVVTGEGRLDTQSTHGKVPVRMAELAQKAGKPCFAIVGTQELDLATARQYGLTSVFPIVDRPMTLAQAIANGKENLARTAARVGAMAASMDGGK